MWFHCLKNHGIRASFLQRQLLWILRVVRMHKWCMHSRDQTAICDWMRKKKKAENYLCWKHWIMDITALANIGKDASNVGCWNNWLSNCVSPFFWYWTSVLFSNLVKTVSNVGVSFLSISQPWKNCFRYWIDITVSNLGNAVSDVGLSFYIYQPWKCSFQYWISFTFTNLIYAVRIGLVIHWVRDSLMYY